ncbi:ELKS/Rab6-interacting/CAST family member 1-like isoform X2 [Clavelina lepadiformis]|uniref:ELKS/Rab6-interacting/CAST family member 1-like isoform X2 n=1 Tax=Clavelina lepadiformis TaxID=159417 RepID=UPI0040416F50
MDENSPDHSIFATCPRQHKKSRTLSVENMQSINAAYAIAPSYSNTFESTGRSKTLGRLKSLARGTSPHRNRKETGVMSSSPNLSLLSSTHTESLTLSDIANMSALGSNRSNSEASQDSPARGSGSLKVNGEEQRSPNRISNDDLILQLQQEKKALRREIDFKENKLQANMHTIKTFWSPELKRERSLRKEETNRIITLREQLRVAQEENQHSQLTMQALQDELRAQRDLNQLLQDDFTSSSHRHDSSFAGLSSLTSDARLLQEDNDRLTRENELLQRTMEEMETRIEAQRQTLDTRDESVRKLLEMVQSRGVSNSDESDVDASVEIDALRVQMSDYESRLMDMDMVLHEKNKEIQKYKEEQNSEVFEDTSKSDTMQALINMKERKIASLEGIIHDLEDRLRLIQHERTISSAEQDENVKQLDIYKSHTTFMKSKIELLKSDLQKKDSEMVTLRTKLDTLNHQQSDSRQHIDVLKESLNAKEQRAAILQSEVDSLRGRLDEKQQILDQKQEQFIQMQEEKSTDRSELVHLQDTLEVKDRKIAVLHKKIENLAEAVREKDHWIEATKKKMASLQQDSSTNDSALSTMEEALTEKERIIEHLHSEIENVEEKLLERVDDMQEAKVSVEKKLDVMKHELGEKETSLSEVKEHASSLASAALKKDSKIKQLEINVEQKTEEVWRLESQLKKAQQAIVSSKTNVEHKEKLEALEKVTKEKTQEAKKCQGDLDRLLEILKETENEKHKKDDKITALEKQVRDLNDKIKSVSTQMVEEIKKKGAALNKDMAQLLLQIKNKDTRIEELEEALRESVKITAEREMVLAREEETRHKLEKQMEELVQEFEQIKNILGQTGGKLAATEASLHEKERCVQQMRFERRKQLEEVLEMKQEALLAAISEKDANIALLELSQSRKKTNASEVCLLRREKDSLVQQLKQQTQNRLKLLQDSEEQSQSSNKTRGNGKLRHRTENDEDDGEGIWA